MPRQPRSICSLYTNFLRRRDHDSLDVLAEHARQNTAAILASRQAIQSPQTQITYDQKLFFIEEGNYDDIMSRLGAIIGGTPVSTEFHRLNHQVADRNLRVWLWQVSNHWRTGVQTYLQGSDAIIFSPDFGFHHGSMQWIEDVLRMCDEYIRRTNCPVFVIPRLLTRYPARPEIETAFNKRVSNLRSYIDTKVRETGMLITLLPSIRNNDPQAVTATSLFNGIIEAIDERKQAAARAAAERAAEELTVCREEPTVWQKLWACCTFQSCLFQRERTEAVERLLP